MSEDDRTGVDWLGLVFLGASSVFCYALGRTHSEPAVECHCPEIICECQYCWRNENNAQFYDSCSVYEKMRAK